jgi:tetratricopeptide (TPR) repeat protein
VPGTGSSTKPAPAVLSDEPRDSLRGSSAPNGASTPRELGLAALREGKLDEAILHLQESLRIEPECPALLHHLGVAFHKKKRHVDAIDCWQRALALQPDLPDTWLCLGHAKRDTGKLEEAAAHYREVVRLRPQAPEGHFHLGDALRHLGRFADAAVSYRECLRLKPDFVEAHHNLGLALSGQGKAKEAEACQRDAIRLQPTHASALNNLGVLLEDRGQLEEAISCFHQSLHHKPDAPETLSNLGVALVGQGKLEEAVECYRKSLRINPGYADAHNNIGNALRDLGEIEEAVSHFEEALRLKPEYAYAYNNLGIARGQQGDLDLAVACYDRALRLKPDYPDARRNRAMAWLAAGDLERGWPEYEYRWQGKTMRPRDFRQPRWDGTPLAGRTILLHAEQGLGDTLQFIRYALLVKQRDGHVLFECPKVLTRILAGCPGIDELIPEGSPLPEFEVQAPLLSLPGLFRTRLETIPANVPYIFPDPALLKHWRESMKHLTGFKIGIAWQGNTKHKLDRHRSIPLRHFAPLAEVPGVRLISLQKGPGAEQLDDGTCGFSAHDLGRFVNTQGVFTDTAAIMKQLDLVICCDTSIAHLAGALGVPIWMAVPFAADWRWMRHGDDSRWYPTIRLFRQKERGNWDEVFARMAGELARRVPGAVSRPTASAVETLEEQAQAHLSEGNLHEAATAFREAIRLRPDLADLHRGLGATLAKQGKVDEAVASFQRALHWRPDEGGLHNDLGLAYLQQDRCAEAERHFQRAAQLKPDSAEMHNNLGVALARQKKHDEAVSCFRQALRLEPRYVEAHTNLGFILRDLGQLDQALVSCREAVRLKPDFAEAHNNLGIILARQGELEQAEACYRRALEIKPDFANARNNLAITVGDLDRQTEALTAFAEALRLSPNFAEARYNRSLTWLRLGRWEEGWPEFECRESLRQRSFRQPRWDGTPLAGRTILLHTEQGMGDTFQFVRFAELVKQQQAKNVLLECPPALVPLLKSCRGIDRVIARGTPLPSFDVYASLLSLPALLKTTLATLPAKVPYLFADPGLVALWARTLGCIRAFRIGIAWQGSPTHLADRFRSLPLLSFSPVAAIDGVQLISLQKQHHEQMADVADRFVVMDMSRQLDVGAGAFMGTAAAMKHLDLVVTCDTAIAHLAGALGVPAWVLLPYAADWRWLSDRDDSPWYPTLRLFRQTKRGDWAEVFHRVSEEIHKLVRPGQGM